MAGWIKISTDIAKHWIWNDAERLKWWIDILFMASWKDTKQLVGKQLVSLRRGQLIASISFLCKRWGRSRSMVEPFLTLLQEEGMISKEVGNNVSIITVVNYEKYQANNSSDANAHIDAYLEDNQSYCKSDYYDNEDNQEDTHLDAHVDAYPDAYLFCKSGAHIDAHLDANNDAYLEDKQSDCESERNSIMNNQSDAHLDTHIDAHSDAYFDAYLDATRKEYKNNNIVVDDVNTARAHEDKNHEFVEELKQSEIWLEQMQMRFKLNADEIKDKLDIFALDCRCRGTEHKNLNDTRRHFNDWLRIQIESQNRKNNDATRQKQENKRRGSDVTGTSAEDYDGAF